MARPLPRRPALLQNHLGGFATALQRRHGYYISCAKYVYDAKEAAGETVTIGMRKGDQLANGSKDIPCEHNIRHNGTMYATANMDHGGPRTSLRQARAR